MKNRQKVVRRLPSLWRQKPDAIITGVSSPEDDDVLYEREQVVSGEKDGNRVLIKNLRKIHYEGKVAVDNLCLGIIPGECVGLLGINGTIICCQL